MLVTRKLALIAVALLVAGCSALPTDSDGPAAAAAAHQTSVAAPDSGSGTTSSSAEADTRSGNLFGSGT